MNLFGFVFWLFASVLTLNLWRNKSKLFHATISGVKNTIMGPRVAASHSKNSNNSNMNGNYALSPTPGAKNTHELFPKAYKEYPDKPTHYFDIYSPVISHLYSQVFWKGLPPVDLPQHIVDKFDNKVMAVVGFELDQVMQDKSTGIEFSIPMNAVYNHHFESTMIGGNTTRFEQVSPQDTRITRNMGHRIPPNQPYWLAVGDKSSGLPQKQFFGAANGGEMRQSFHGYAPGFAQLIESPRQFQVTPMQIDTWHREAMDLKNTTYFVAGPLPRNSLAPPNATYSGLLECPVTTRLSKHFPMEYYPWNQPSQCGDKHQNSINDGNIVRTAQDCYEAVTKLIREINHATDIRNVSGSDDNRPMGCSIRILNELDASIIADDGQRPQLKREEFYIEAYYNNQNGTTKETCGSTSATQYLAFATSLVNVTVSIDTEHDLVTITLVGPTDVWFGVGFGAQQMADLPWTIIVEGDTVTERKLQDHGKGTVVTPSSIQVQSNIVNTDKTRTVIATRSITGKYYSFDTTSSAENPFINAIGSSLQFSYHKKKEASSLLFLPVHTGGLCLCQRKEPPFGKATGGYVEYHPVPGQAGERGEPTKIPAGNKCVPYPRMDLLEQRNPTCDIRTYTGGQDVCHHMWSLLDADQEIPWPCKPIEYRLKFRFWFQEYDSSYHNNVQFTRWGIGSPVEYDVPKCSHDKPGCSWDTEENRWVHTIRGSFVATKGVGHLVAAHFHCHAPTCLKTALYRCPTSLPCNETTGTLLCEQEAVHHHGKTGERFNEPDFIYQPPCLWGSPTVGLEPPVHVRNQTLFAIKTADATYGHHGEMAWLQIFYT